MDKSEIEQGLKELNRRFPEKWYHNYHFRHGIQTIPGQPKDDNFLIRSDIVMELTQFFLGVSSAAEIRRQSLRLLDLGSAESLQSIEAALHGFDVVSVEGRRLFIDRAEFAKKVFALENVRFVESDVRQISIVQLGSFEVTLCLGLLYHLNKEALLPFLSEISKMTKRMLILDTHISNDYSLRRYKLGAEDNIGGRYFSRVFNEHPRGLSLLQKLSRVRASLDNEQSFWLEYDSLCQMVNDHGFNYVLDVRRPVHNLNQDFLRTRVLLAAVKMPNLHLPSKSYLSPKWAISTSTEAK
jgi:2-polyprenyl-3-methyl-5-hydroxy-6-metoxy-1,4-benzoquinol methylase